MSTWAAQSAQAASRLSWSRSSSPLWRGAVAGRVQGVTAGQPVTISVGAGEGGALAPGIQTKAIRQIIKRYWVTYVGIDVTVTAWAPAWRSWCASSSPT
jgi:hypothetical protein